MIVHWLAATILLALIRSSLPLSIIQNRASVLADRLFRCSPLQSGNSPYVLSTDSYDQYTFIQKLRNLKLPDAIGRVCGEKAAKSDDTFAFFPGAELLPQALSPTINRFVVANPLTFFFDQRLLKVFQLDLAKIEEEFLVNQDLSVLARYLPVVYLAEAHSEMGFLGFQLNRRKFGETIEAVNPFLRALRDRPIYRGGPDNSGSSLYMIHKRKDFIDNRSFRTLPRSVTLQNKVLGQGAFELFFSPNFAFANELCLTGIAKPSEFKFFRWACIWPPGLLEDEAIKQHRWLNVQAPCSLLFADECSSEDVRGVPTASEFVPLYSRVMSSID